MWEVVIGVTSVVVAGCLIAQTYVMVRKHIDRRGDD